MTVIATSTSDPTTVDADVVLIGVAPATDAADGRPGITLAGGAASLDAALDGRLAETLTLLGAKGSPGEITRLATLGAISAPTLVAVGLGKPEAGRYPTEALRRAAGAAVRALAGTAAVATVLAQANADAVTDNDTDTDTDVSGDHGSRGPQAPQDLQNRRDGDLAAVAEGALLGGYRFGAYRTTRADDASPVGTVTLLGAETSPVLRRAEILAESIHLARDLVNTPPRDLPPAVFAERARALGTEAGLSVEVLDDEELRTGGYGGITGVGQGSSRPPRLVRLEHVPGAAATETVALVGKGITFDSGGLSLKPPASMETMKSDMAGAAAVLATLLAAARLDLGVRVVGYLALAENMPSGEAIRPSDVLTMYGGKTVEVLNTDAEGRLVLADALVRSGEDDPGLVIDIATLTGAQTIALGNYVSGVMGTTAGRGQVVAAGDRTGESMWPMPLPPEIRSSLDSDVADIKNIGERLGGMLTAGLFLREFVPAGAEWAHIDIAGPSFVGKAYGYTPKGGTGVGVRTLLGVLEDVASRS